jgi:uncharacterized protein (DUF983 family)
VDEPTDPADEAEPTPIPLTVPRLLARGLARRCPVCGASGLFRRWFVLQERCPRCNFRLEQRIEGHWLGSLGINTIVSFGALAVTMAVGLAIAYPEGDLGPLLVAAVAVAVLVPLAFFPFSKTLWSAIDLAMRPLEPDDDVDPRWIPPPAHHPRRYR